MPELPEVETMRRGIAGICGRAIRTVRTMRCRRKPIRIEPGTSHFRRRVSGQTITAIQRIGKRVVLRLAGEDAIVIEPRMTGLVLLADPPSRAHLRFCIELEGAAPDAVYYWDRRGLGSVRLLNVDEFQTHLGEAKLGPDALALSAEQLRSRLAYSRREIKVALLDQKAIAGIGNLYASEILHRAGIHPQRACNKLVGRQWLALFEAMQEVLLQAIRYEGSTLSDGTYRNALNESGSYQNQHRVYARAGSLCAGCGRGRINRIVQAQRSTFYCPACQRKTARAPSK